MLGFEITEEDLVTVFHGSDPTDKFLADYGLTSDDVDGMAEKAFPMLTKEDLQAISESAAFDGDIDEAVNNAHPKIIEILTNKGILAPVSGDKTHSYVITVREVSWKKYHVSGPRELSDDEQDAFDSEGMEALPPEFESQEIDEGGTFPDLVEIIEGDGN